MLITFSGLDGAGKTTLIKSLAMTLEGRNRRTVILTMYDHIGIYPLVRYIRDCIKSFIRSARGDLTATVGSASTDPERLGSPTMKRGWLVAMVYAVVRGGVAKRIALPLDLLIFVFYRLYFEIMQKRVFITDRYFYDSLADVLRQPKGFYMRVLLLLIPSPDLSIFVDVSPEVAFARKGEYSLEYLAKRRIKYQRIFAQLDRPLILANNELAMARSTIEAQALDRIGSQ